MIFQLPLDRWTCFSVAVNTYEQHELSDITVRFDEKLLIFQV